MYTATLMELLKTDETKAYNGELPADLCAGRQLKFVYTNITDYHYVGVAKRTLLCVIDSKQRLKNGSVCELEPTHRIFFSTLNYGKISSNTLQLISIELRTKAGHLVLFSVTHKLILTLQFKSFGE